MDLGLDRAGFECAFQVEIDPFCQRVLAKHWPNVTRYGDIKNVTGYELERVDLLCGGFPCQSSSHAGKRRGRDDERWLWPEFARLIRGVRPRYVLVENVPGLLSPIRDASGRIVQPAPIDAVLGDLAASGYDAEWQSLPAAAFGAPHIRERVWIVAYARSVQSESGHDFDEKQRWQKEAQQTGMGNSRADVPHADRSRLSRNAQPHCKAQRVVFPSLRRLDTGRRAEWDPEPAICRVDARTPARMDRLRALGNAVVPAVVEYIGRLILAHAERTTQCTS